MKKFNYASIQYLFYYLLLINVMLPKIFTFDTGLNDSFVVSTLVTFNQIGRIKQHVFIIS